MNLKYPFWEVDSRPKFWFFGQNTHSWKLDTCSFFFFCIFLSVATSRCSIACVICYIVQHVFYFFSKTATRLLFLKPTKIAFNSFISHFRTISPPILLPSWVSSSFTKREKKTNHAWKLNSVATQEWAQLIVAQKNRQIWEDEREINGSWDVKRGENLKEDDDGGRECPAETTVTHRRFRRKTRRGENGKKERKRKKKISCFSEAAIYRRRRTVERLSWRECNQWTVPSYPAFLFSLIYFYFYFYFYFWQFDTV